MTGWICQHCRSIVWRRTGAPGSCPKCGLSKFEPVADRPASPSRRGAPIPHEPGPSGPTMPAPPADLQLRRFSVLPEAAPAPRRERRRAKRVRPKEPVHVRLSWGPPLPILDISAVGLLVELTRLVKPGTRCEVELARSGHTVRLRGEVVRSSVASGTGSDTGLQYRTAVQFLATPPTLFTLVPELSEEA